MTLYTPGFAAFYDRYFTGWVKDYSPRLVEYLEETRGAERTVLDLCCGTGITAAAFAEAGWRVVGVDRSPGMLGIARERLAGRLTGGQVELVEDDATRFALPAPVSTCVCLDGALNHLESTDQLRQCFERVHAALADGGQFVFDLFEVSHFMHWNSVSMTDQPDAIVVKRGVWDETVDCGLLRVSGAFGEGATRLRMDQTLRSVAFTAEEVAAALEAAGFTPAGHGIEDIHQFCRSGVCARAGKRCRTMYRGVKGAVG